MAQGNFGSWMRLWRWSGRELFFFNSLLWQLYPLFVTHPVARAICSWSAGTKMLTVAAVMLASTIHNVRSWRTVLSDHNSRCPFVAPRERLHPNLISWLEGDTRLSCFLAVVVVFLINFILILQTSDLQWVIGCWCEELTSCKKLVSWPPSH